MLTCIDTASCVVECATYCELCVSCVIYVGVQSVSVVTVVPFRARLCPSARSPPVPRNIFPCGRDVLPAVSKSDMYMYMYIVHTHEIFTCPCWEDASRLWRASFGADTVVKAHKVPVMPCTG